MGQLTDTLRATLRDLAQSDARLYRGLQEELGDPRPASDQPAVLLAGDAPASREELERLKENARAGTGGRSPQPGGGSQTGRVPGSWLAAACGRLGHPGLARRGSTASTCQRE
mgnify:CR=1 FL=1